LKVIKLKPLKLSALDDEPKDRDDAIQEVKQETIERRSGSVVSAPTNKDKKQPAYLKSVTHVVVHNPANKEAPYGLDESGKPILPGRSDQELATDLLSKPFLKAGSCPHKSNPKYCLLCGTANYKAAPAETVDLEDQLRRMFGITGFVATTGRGESKKFAYFPEILGITRGQLIGLLELTVGIEPRAIKKKILKSRTIIDGKIAELERTSSRIIELNTLIANSEELIRSWSAHVMKIQVKRGERHPDDILDKKTREQFKREEKKNIEKYEQEKHELQKLLRDTDIDALRQRAATWGSNPDDHDITSATENATVKFGEKFKFGHEDEDEGEDSTPDQNIDGYLALLDQYDLLKDVSRRLRQFPTLDVWRHFENEIVLQAIGWRLVRPTKQAFVEYPQLAKYMHGAPTDDTEQDAIENKLILKTGGAQIGGGIYGCNKGGAPMMKTFEKYDRNYRRGNDSGTEYGGERPDNFFGGMDSGDLDERGGDE